ncbi:MAG TPA: methyl-accepting chemotaxis protein [Magnetospirillum sp.]|nr:methyl-accepting chemotaxis protein [Magnetospirillum sp.]
MGRLLDHLLGRISIRVRIAALVALALGGALVFAAIYAAANQRTDQALAAQDGYTRLYDLAAEVQASALTLQVQTEQFVRERDPSYAKAFHDQGSRLMAVLDTMSANTQASARQGEINGLRTAFQELDATFLHLETEIHRLGLSDRDGLRGSLGASVKAIEDELTMWPNAAPLMVDMLQMRQAEKTFMITRDAAALGHHTRHARQFDLVLDATTLPPSTRADFRRLLEAYVSDFQSFAASSTTVDAQLHRIRDLHSALAPQVADLFAFARDGAATAIADQQAVREAALWETSAAGLVGVVAFSLLALAIAHSITAPLRLIENAMRALAGGDHRVEIPCAERTDEIGDMATAVQVFKQNAERVARIQIEQENMRREVEAASRDQVLTLAQRFEDTVRGVAEEVTTKAVEIHQTAGGIAGADGDSRENGWSLAIAEAAEQARGTVAAVTRATAELTQSVTCIAGQGAAVGQAVTAAIGQLGTAEDRVQALAEMARRIDRVVALIGDIAQRTNMLALNASIEAQRAGEAGKGFAVVAGEVKRLAMQTVESAAEIASQIAAVQGATDDTVHAIVGVGKAVRDMDALAQYVQQAVAQQAEVARTIEHCVADVTDKTYILSNGVTAFTHSAAHQCGAAAKVLWAAEDLAEPTRTLKDEVDTFLATVRAA